METEDETPRVPVSFVPFAGTDPEDAVRLGGRWLRDSPGPGLVLLSTKGTYTNNPLLPKVTVGAAVAKPGDLWRADWRRGPVLAPWPTHEVLDCLDGLIPSRAAGVCVLEWGTDVRVSAWLEARAATSLVDGTAAPSTGPLLDPVVEAAMRELGGRVNHANGLVGWEKDSATDTLTELVRAGHRYDTARLCAWAAVNGFTGSEVGTLRGYADQALAGHRFRRSSGRSETLPGLARWEAVAADEPDRP